MSELTQNQKYLSVKYLVYQFLTNLWFVGAIWLYFYRLFITDAQVGILDGFAFAIGLVVEVPSGVLADRFGRDRLVKLGQILAGSGLLIQAVGGSFVPLFVGQAIVMIGISLVSGADEALFFDKLKFDPKTLDWRKLVTRGSQVALIGTLFATIAGGWLHGLNPRLPWILNGFAFVGSALMIWSMKEERKTRVKQTLFVELKDHLMDIKNGFAEFLTPKLGLYVPVIITVQGLFYTVGWGLLRLVLLDRFHFSEFWGSVVIASSSLITVGILALMHRYAENLSEKRVIVLISLGAVASLLLSIADIGMWGYVVILSLYTGEHVLYPFMSEVLNLRASDRHRATVLSVASFLRILPYVVLAPVIGYLNSNGRLEYFLIFWSGLIVIAVLVYILLKRKDLYVSMIKKEIETEPRVSEI